jgi:DNA-binding GntR family transcriptional regulator
LSGQVFMPMHTHSSPSSTETKRGRVAFALESEIRRGQWAIGTRLPSEAKLMERFGVGRQTVRDALSELKARSLVDSHQGVGSVVLRRSAQPEYSQSLDSIEELLCYARNTKVEIVESTEVVLDDAQAALIGAAPGSRWIHAQTTRTAASQKVPMGISSVWVPAANRAAVQASRRSGLPVFLEMQKARGLLIERVEQVLGASMPTKAQAKRLQCPPGEPLLRLQRWYLAAHDTLIEMSDTLHPNTRFQYAMTLRRSAGTLKKTTSRTE